jgi:hypothetical protein
VGLNPVFDKRSQHYAFYYKFENTLFHEFMKGSNSFTWFCRSKPNVKNAGEAQLHNNWEHITIGFYSGEGGRGMEYYNFRNNVVIANAVSKKLLHSSDQKPIHVYQKP